MSDSPTQRMRWISRPLVSVAAALALLAAAWPTSQGAPPPPEPGASQAGPPAKSPAPLTVSDYTRQAASTNDPALVWIRAAESGNDQVRLEAANQLRTLADPRAVVVLAKLAQLKPTEFEREGPLYDFPTVARDALEVTRAKMKWDELAAGHADPQERLKALLSEYQTASRALQGRIEEYVVKIARDDEMAHLLLHLPPASPLANEARALRIRQGRELDRQVADALAAAKALPLRMTEADRERLRQRLSGAIAVLRGVADPADAPRLADVLVLDDRLDPDGSLGTQARTALAQYGGAVLPLLEDILKSSAAPAHRLAAVLTVAQIGGPKAQAILRAAAQREDPEQNPQGNRDVYQRIKAQLARLQDAGKER